MPKHDPGRCTELHFRDVETESLEGVNNPDCVAMMVFLTTLGAQRRNFIIPIQLSRVVLTLTALGSLERLKLGRPYSYPATNNTYSHPNISMHLKQQSNNKLRYFCYAM